MSAFVWLTLIETLHDLHRPSPIDWVIMGVESRANRTLGHLPAEPPPYGDAIAIDPQRLGELAYWKIARVVHAQCQAAGVAFFQKQGPIRGRLSTEPLEWALEDRVQEFPR